MREICLDIETTGLDPKQGHKIVEIACIELVNRVKTKNHFHVYVNPRRDMPEEAFAVHGISSEFLEDKPIFDHVANKFLEFIEGANIVIHNAAFDTKFLNHELQLMGKSALDKSKVIDSLILARKKFPGAPASLDALCKRYGIDLSKRTLHGALLDTELLCDVYIELMGGAQEDFKFSSGNDSSKYELKSDISKLCAQQKISTKKINPTPEDLDNHKKFILENFKENLWGY